MEKQIHTFEDLSEATAEYLRQQSFSETSLRNYCSTWSQVKEFMEVHHLTVFNAATAEMFLKDRLGNYQFESLCKHQKQFIRRINVLREYQETGFVLKKRINQEIVMTGQIGIQMSNFIGQNKTLGHSSSTINSHKLYLSRFLKYLTENGITSPEMINQITLVTFVNDYGIDKPIVKHCMLSVIKGFMRYLYDQKVLDVDYSKIIPKSNYKAQAKLPSVYSKEEITKVLGVIDRGSPKGKRDYAIMLLAVRLGLRSSDIINLQFENLLWQQCQISLMQQKTKQEINFNLTKEVGEAIINYLQFGRPVSKLPYVFLNLIPPYDQMTNINLSTMASNYYKEAGIKIKERKHGMHSLRHSLAGILLENKIPLPVISEVLGHKNTCSTMYYLRIDQDALRQCTLNVPSVSRDFYHNVRTMCFTQKS